MTDIVERLRENVTWLERDGFLTNARNTKEAADEIERLRAELAALRGQNAEPVEWEYRTFHGDNTVTPGWSAWEKVEPRNPHTDTVDDRVREFQGYISQGYKYELRALYRAPQPETQDGWIATHLKTGNEYRVIGEAINATNAQDGQTMVIYKRAGVKYVREAGEFMEKFSAAQKPGDAE